MKKFLLLVLIGFFSIGCGTPQKIPTEAVKEAGKITLKFVQINDVYEIAPVNAGEFGGMARVAHIRDSIKKEFPNTFMFLAGDFLNPSLLGTLKVDGERVNGKQMVEVLNAMDIDLVTFGNHEFDLDEKDLQKRLDQSEFRWTSANAWHLANNDTVPFNSLRENTKVPVSDYTFFDAVDASGNSINFGVFGVTLPSTPKDYVFYGNIYAEAERAYNSALQKSDFVVGLTHVAIEEDKRIAELIPSLPLIMGGHEHYNMLQKEGNTIITKADANAKSLYVHTLTYDLKTKDLFIDSELVMVTDKIASSPKVEAIVDKWTNFLDNKLKEVIQNPDEVIYNAAIPLDGTDTNIRSRQTNLGELIARAMSYTYANNVEGAFVNSGSIRIDDKLQGDITSTDIFRILPFGGSVLKVDITGKLLKQVLDFGLSASGEGAYLQHYDISQDPYSQWQVAGKNLIDDKIYSLAISDFLLRGLDIPFLTPENEGVINIYLPKEDETASDIRKVIISYLNSLKK